MMSLLTENAQTSGDAENNLLRVEKNVSAIAKWLPIALLIVELPLAFAFFNYLTGSTIVNFLLTATVFTVPFLMLDNWLLSRRLSATIRLVRSVHSEMNATAASTDGPEILRKP